MAQDHSFDIVSKIDLQEVRNGVQTALKEARQRYDFKDSVIEIDFDEKARTMKLLAGDAFKLKSLSDILIQRLSKRGVSLKALTFGEVDEKMNGQAGQVLTLQEGIPSDKAKEMVKSIKEMRLKVQPSIQEDQVRVTAPKIDDLQTVMQVLRGKDFGIHMQFENYR